MVTSDLGVTSSNQVHHTPQYAPTSIPPSMHTIAFQHVVRSVRLIICARLATLAGILCLVLRPPNKDLTPPTAEKRTEYQCTFLRAFTAVLVFHMMSTTTPTRCVGPRQRKHPLSLGCRRQASLFLWPRARARLGPWSPLPCATTRQHADRP